MMSDENRTTSRDASTRLRLWQTVKAVANNTTLTVTSNTSFTGTGNTIELVTQKKAAFKYTRNNYVVRYHDANNGAFDTYKYMAVKIVLLSPFNYLVPTLNDVRVLAVSV